MGHSHRGWQSGTLRVRELDLYLNKHGFTTVGRKLKAIRVMKMTWNPRMKNSKVRRQRATMTLFSRIWMNRVAATIQFISDEQITAVVVQGP